MRTYDWRSLALLMVAVGCWSLGPLQAQDQAAEGAAGPAADAAVGDEAPAAEPAVIEIPRVTASFRDAEFAEVITALYEKTGFGFIVGPGVAGKVSASFDNQPLDAMVKTLCDALGLTVERHERIFVIRDPRVQVAPSPDAPRPIAGDPTGATPPAGDTTTAGALLPGSAPTSELYEPGAEDFTGADEEPPAAEPLRPGGVRAQLPVSPANAQALSTMLGGGWVDGYGVYHSPQEMAYMRSLAQQQNYSRAPLWADSGYDRNAQRPRYNRGGAILDNQGNIIRNDGVILDRNGNIYMPGGGGGYNYRPNYYPYNQNQGGLYVQPGPINLGGLGTVYLPPFTIGQNGDRYPYQNRPIVGGQYGLPGGFPGNYPGDGGYYYPPYQGSGQLRPYPPNYGGGSTYRPATGSSLLNHGTINPSLKLFQRPPGTEEPEPEIRR